MLEILIEYEIIRIYNNKFKIRFKMGEKDYPHYKTSTY